jgi:arginine exporter protein ArgO
MPAALTALVLGALAGLAVAMPVGPVGVLLLRTGLLQGTRVAVGAAAGIATVDAAYAVLAVAAGTPVSRLATTHADVTRLLSSTVLLAVGVATLVAWWRTRTPLPAPAPTRESATSPATTTALSTTTPAPSTPAASTPAASTPAPSTPVASTPALSTPAPSAAPSTPAVTTPTARLAGETNIPVDPGPAVDRDVGLVADPAPGDPGSAPGDLGSEVGDQPGRRAWRAYGTFVGLTAVNPLTAVTFATVAVGLAARVGERPGISGAMAFVVGAGVASLAWQLMLAVVSGRLGGRLGPAGRSRASLVGALVVVALAVVVAAG